MRVFKLDKMIKGWFVGNFSPSAYKSEAVEVAVKHYKKAEFEERHYHKIATELTLIVKGSVMMNGKTFNEGDIILIEPNESTDFKALKDSITAVVKLPSVKNDKFNETNSAQMNVLIAMAGAGKRFKQARYTKPKPFIRIFCKAMIELVLENLALPRANYILIAQKAHLKKEQSLIQKIKREFQAQFIEINALTQGTACTLLYAIDFIDNEKPLLIANCDQIVDININDFVKDCFKRKLDGSILCFKDKTLNPKWSFVRLNKDNLVQEVREKEAISDLATVGIYLFARGKNFVRACFEMIKADERVNNEFYTAITYNYAIANGLKIGAYTINSKAMNALGTPDDLTKYLKNARKDKK